jgi:hypothetical protein
MRNPSTNLLASWLAVLLMSSVACVRASFPPIPVGTGGAGVGGAGGSGGQIAGAGGGAGAADSGLGPDVSVTCPQTPVTPVPNCTPTIADPCDPVCQSGSMCDWCHQKCTFAFLGATAQATCAARDPSPVKDFQPCAVTSYGSSVQDDNCLPGSICLQPINGGNVQNGYCFKLCHTAIDDCPGVDCTQRSLSSGTVNVCDPPYDSCGPDGNCCDPFASSTSDASTGSCGQGRVCLLVSFNPSSLHSRTVCEFSGGAGKNGDHCSSAHDCQFANTCVIDGVHNGCHRVCNSANTCPAGPGDCVQWGTEYGFCASD